MDLNLVLAYAFGLILIYVLARLLFLPVKLLVTLLYNAVIGGIILFGINWVLSAAGTIGIPVALRLPVNPFTALIAGLLGLPGLILVVVLQYLW